MSKESILFVVHQPDHLKSWAKAAEAIGYEVEWLCLNSSEELVLDDLVRAFTVVVEWLPTAGGFKTKVLNVLESVLNNDTLILSASHEIMATQSASQLTYSNRLIGFSPMGSYRESSLVTLSNPYQGDAHLQQRAERFFQALKLESVWIQDTPGMVLPRIYAMLVNEAAYALQSGVASVEDIDTAMRLGTNYPLGPFAWADRVGIDTVVTILDNLWHMYREERYRPCLLLQKMHLAGTWGEKTGRGFYPHAPSSSSLPSAASAEAAQV